jgi:hypothetical protein
MTNASDFRGIWYAVADAIKKGWNEMGTQVKGFFVTLLFSWGRQRNPLPMSRFGSNLFQMLTS